MRGFLANYGHLIIILQLVVLHNRAVISQNVKVIFMEGKRFFLKMYQNLPGTFHNELGSFSVAFFGIFPEDFTELIRHFLGHTSEFPETQS